jgi:hypothetical protein
LHIINALFRRRLAETLTENERTYGNTFCASQ